MIQSLLLHVDGDDRGTAAIPAVVQLAAAQNARVRGLMVVDTRNLIAAAVGCESAVYAAAEVERLDRQEELQSSALSQLATACLRAGIDFDVRRLRGNPLELVPREARFHDLAITIWPLRPAEGSDADGVRTLTELARRGAQPLLVLRDAQGAPQRLLLVFDGSVASERAVKQFLSQQLFADAEMRLLAIGSSDQEARSHLRQLSDCLRNHRGPVELGHMHGALKQVLPAYVQKWEADLVVLGVPHRDRLFGSPWCRTVADVLRETPAALYASS